MTNEQVLNKIETYNNRIDELSIKFDLTDDIKEKSIIMEEMMSITNESYKLFSQHNFSKTKQQ